VNLLFNSVCITRELGCTRIDFQNSILNWYAYLKQITLTKKRGETNNKKLFIYYLIIIVEKINLIYNV